jgi:hypothetical protein
MKNIILIITLFCLPKLMAQQATAASGGNASGSNGSSSYSVGQVVYVAVTGSNGAVSQGVQQPIEIFTLSGEEFANITLEAIVFPNPTISNVTLKISNFSLDALSYQLFDIHGKSISAGKISNEETFFNMDAYPASIYILKITSNSKELKTFKIIKN